MAIQYYMRGWYPTGNVYVDWVVNDTPDTTGQFAPNSPLTNITVNRVVTSKVDNFLNPFQSTTLTSGATFPGATTLSVTSTAQFPSSGTLYIELNTSPQTFVTVTYNGTTPTTFQNILTSIGSGSAISGNSVYSQPLVSNSNISSGYGNPADPYFLHVNGFDWLNTDPNSPTFAVPTQPTGLAAVRGPGNPYSALFWDEPGNVWEFAQILNNGSIGPVQSVSMGSLNIVGHLGVQENASADPGFHEASIGLIRIPNQPQSDSTGQYGAIRARNSTNSGDVWLISADDNTAGSSPYNTNRVQVGSATDPVHVPGPYIQIDTFIAAGTNPAIDASVSSGAFILQANGATLNAFRNSGGTGDMLGVASSGNLITLGDENNQGMQFEVGAIAPNSTTKFQFLNNNFDLLDIITNGNVGANQYNTSISFSMLATLPTITQAAVTSAGGQTLKIIAQSSGSAAGGPLVLQGGQGSVNGYVDVGNFGQTLPMVRVFPNSAPSGGTPSDYNPYGGTTVNNASSIIFNPVVRFPQTFTLLPSSNLFHGAGSAAVSGPVIGQDDISLPNASAQPMTISAQWNYNATNANGGKITVQGGSTTATANGSGGNAVFAGGNAPVSTLSTTQVTYPSGDPGVVRAGGNILLNPGTGAAGNLHQGEIDWFNAGNLVGRFFADTFSPFMELGSNSNAAHVGFIRLSNNFTDTANPQNKTALAMRKADNSGDILLIGSDQDGYVVVGNGSSVIIGGNFVNSDVNPASTTTYIAGNLQVWGTSTIVDSTIIDIVGRVIHANWPLNPRGGVPVAPPMLIAGYDVNRGSIDGYTMNDGAAIIWTEGVQTFNGSDGYWRFATISQDGYSTTPRDNLTIANSPNALSVMASSFAPVSNTVMNQTGSALIASGVLPGVGGLRTLNNTTAVSARNAAATADLLMLGSDASNHIVMGASSNPQNAGFIFNTPSGDLFDFWVNSTSEVQISSDGNGPFVRESATTFVPATTGFIRVPNNVTAVAARGQANTFDHLLLGTDTNDHITMGATSSPHNTGFIFNTLGTTTSNAPFDFWVNSVTTVQLASSDYDADLFAETIGIGPTVSNPRLYQITQSGTGANAGFNMKISAQSGQLQTGATNNNNGGNMFVASGKAGTGGTGASAVDGYVGILGGTTQIVYFYDYDPDNDGYAEAIQIGPSILYPRIYQAQQTGFGNSKGYDLKIQAQQGQAVSSGTNNNGGNLILASGPNGTGGSGGSAGNIELDIDGTIEVIFTDGSFQWQSGLTNAPTFSQANITTASAVGQTLTVQAQNATGTTSTGGNLNLSSGTGTTSNGAVQLQVGGTTTASVVTNKFVFNQGRRRHVTPVTTTYQVLATDDLIAITTLSAPFTITLPASPTTGDSYEVKDTTGNAGTNNITINGNGNNIDASGTFTLNQPYGAITVTFTGSAWSIT